mgnify:CR=1 FL=1
MYMLRHKNEQSFHKIHLHREPTTKAHTHTHTHTHTYLHSKTQTHSRPQYHAHRTSKGDKRTKLSHTKQRERTREHLKRQVLKLT